MPPSKACFTNLKFKNVEIFCIESSEYLLFAGPPALIDSHYPLEDSLLLQLFPHRLSLHRLQKQIRHRRHLHLPVPDSFPETTHWLNNFPQPQLPPQ